MERVALAVLLVACLPNLALAQDVELAVLVSGYQPVPGVQSYEDHFDCSADPCPSPLRRRIAWGGGASLLGRLGFRVSQHIGIDAVIQHVKVADEHSWAHSDGSGSAVINSTSTFMVLQPSYRFRLADSVNATVAIGAVTALQRWGSTSGASGTDRRWGMAFAAALQMPIRGALDLELRVSDYLYFESDAFFPQRDTHDLTYGVGLAYSLGASQ